MGLDARPLPAASQTWSLSLKLRRHLIFGALVFLLFFPTSDPPFPHTPLDRVPAPPPATLRVRRSVFPVFFSVFFLFLETLQSFSGCGGLYFFSLSLFIFCAPARCSNSLLFLLTAECYAVSPVSQVPLAQFTLPPSISACSRDFLCDIPGYPPYGL